MTDRAYADNPPPWEDLADAARLALRCLDLTSLNANDSAADIALLCERAQSPWGQVAAVCVWPQWVALARSLLPPSIAVAAVANFPQGLADIESAVRDTQSIVQSGAQEVDVVLPYRALMAGDAVGASKVLVAVRYASEGLCLKVILETGALVDSGFIAQACQISLDAGADFLKTSTGKTPVSATPDAARTMLDAIAQRAGHGRVVGFKASGGIKTVQDARVYLRLAAQSWGVAAVEPQRFRLGASGVLSDIEAILAGRPTAPVGSSAGY